MNDGPPAHTPRLSAWPNPFNPTTTIEFSVDRTQWVSIAVFDVAGRRVSDVAKQTFGPGTHSMTWTGRDDQNRAVPSGTYLVRMDTGDGKAARKISLVR